MRFFHHGKDGGPLSTVWGLFIVELKRLFTIVVLRFENGTRESYHDHAFHALSWVVKGRLEERIYPGHQVRVYTPSLFPIFTPRKRFHQVRSVGRTWVFSLRGPWAKVWHEYHPQTGRQITLTHGRKEAA